MSTLTLGLGKRRADVVYVAQNDTANTVTITYDRAMKLKDVYAMIEMLQNALASFLVQDR